MIKAHIVIKDEVNCSITNLMPHHQTYFYNKYGEFAPNYFFNPEFTLGRWDGKIRFFHKNGNTFVYMLENLIPQLTDMGYQIVLDDRRTSAVHELPLIDADIFSHVTDLDTDEPLTIRPYQVGAGNALLPHTNGVVTVATGGGKTILTGCLIEQLQTVDARVIVIVPGIDLVLQTAEELNMLGIDTGSYCSDSKDLDRKHLVSTWQSLSENPSLLHLFQAVIVDECHKVKGNVLTKLLNDHGKDIVYRYGVTGTLPKSPSDRRSVLVALGPHRYSITAADLIAQGYLATLNIRVYQLVEDFKKEYQEYLDEYDQAKTLEKPLTYVRFKTEFFPDYSSEKRYLNSNKKRRQWIVDLIETVSAKRQGNTLCLVNSIASGKQLNALIPNSHFIYGKDKKEARKKVYDLFKDNDNVVVIATVQIASTGINIKRLFNLVCVDMGKSFIQVIQTIGRGLRKAPDKDSVFVADVCSDLKYSKKHCSQRMKYYKDAEYPHKKVRIDM